ncbi:Intraflagellar transport protein 57 [Kappamyces sp. JEL0829]|nr:Intraflagellar transport protein 57 [Kappamyces sp. JEL0829]
MTAKREDSFGSLDNLASAGRSTSRSNLIPTASADDILDKLKALNYQQEFCIPNNWNPIHRFYFQVADANPNEQLHIFASLTAWLLQKVGVAGFEKPGQFDDPNATCANIVAELKKLGIPFEYGPTKLKQAYGEACIYVLQSLVDMAIAKLKIQFRSPVHRLDDYPEEAEVDHDAEITTEAVEEEIEANQEEDEAFTFALGKVNKTDDIIEQVPVAPKTDPAEWRLEVERVTPLLKVKLPNDNKDWRLHLQQMSHHQQKIQGIMVTTQDQLGKLHSDIEQILEKISSREKYINAQFEAKINQFKRLQDSSSDSKQKYTVATSNVTELTNELTRISEELDSIKSRMDDLGSGMTDSKPLQAIKQGATKLKVEIKQMDLRIGVIENTLLHAKMKGKGASGSTEFSVQGHGIGITF